MRPAEDPTLFRSQEKGGILKAYGKGYETQNRKGRRRG